MEYSAHPPISPQSDSTEKLYTRRLLCPIDLTVQQTLTADHLRLQPWQVLTSKAVASPHMERLRSSQRTRSQSISHLDSAVESRLQSLKAEDSCIALLDVCNRCDQPFEVSLERASKGSVAARQRIEAGATSTLLIPIDRARLISECSSGRPIPPPKIAKQYVVSAERKRMSQRDQALERELFWYREYLFEQLHASWGEVRVKLRAIN